MKTLEQIRNDYAVTQGCKDFSELLMTTYKQSDLGDIYDDLLFLVQKECLKLASENAEVDEILELNGDRYYLVNKESITNEKNIIK